MRIRVNPVAVASMGVSLEDVRNAISNANAASALGTFDGSDLAHTIGSNDQLRTVPEYKNLVVKSASGTVVRLGAIADVELGVRNSRSAAWFNMQPSVLLVVTKQADANVIDTVDRIYEMLPELKRWIPADVQISVLSDRTTTIRASIRDMQWTLLATIVLVMMVVFLFSAPCRGNTRGWRHGAARAGRHLRRDVGGRLFDRQHLANGARGVGRFRGR